MKENANVLKEPTLIVNHAYIYQTRSLPLVAMLLIMEQFRLSIIRS